MENTYKFIALAFFVLIVMVVQYGVRSSSHDGLVRAPTPDVSEETVAAEVGKLHSHVQQCPACECVCKPCPNPERESHSSGGKHSAAPAWSCPDTTPVGVESSPITFPHGYKALRTAKSHSIGWWKRDFEGGGWERGTFDVFHKYIDSETTVIDFGAWIGPTVLFHGQFAKRVYAIECDPYAFEELNLNVLLNPNVACRTTLEHYCISNQHSRQVMAGTGESLSALRSVSEGLYQRLTTENYSNGAVTRTWEVVCVPLPWFVQQRHIDTDNLFIKIDTEGAERFIVPSLYDWISSLKIRPTIYLSTHGFWDEKDTAGVLRVIKLYNYMEGTSTLSVNSFPGSGSFLLHDKIK